MLGVVITESAVRRRPRDRADRIVAAALTLFAERGFYSVGIDEVGAAVGISGPAVYRHYATKNDVLAAALRYALTSVRDNIDAAVGQAITDDERLDAFLAASVVAVMDHWHETHLLYREVARVDANLTLHLMNEWSEAERTWNLLVRRVRPELDRRDAGTVLIAVNGLLLGGAPVEPAPGRSRHVDLLSRSARAIVESYEPTDRARRGGNDRGGVVGSFLSRREVLFASAVRLFLERGYDGVGMADIGASDGVTGSAVYRHFATKAEVLGVILNRAPELLAAASADALSHARNPRDALTGLIDRHVAVTMAHGDLITLFLNDVRYLPLEEFPSAVRAHRAYVDDWMRVVRALRPDLQPSDVRVLVNASHSLVAAVARARLLPQEAVGEVVRTMARRSLLVP
jgi:AcrR family transcriptional regulator